jgi:hypothetical protein
MYVPQLWAPIVYILLSSFAAALYSEINYYSHKIYFCLTLNLKKVMKQEQNTKQLAWSWVIRCQFKGFCNSPRLFKCAADYFVVGLLLFSWFRKLYLP